MSATTFDAEKADNLEDIERQFAVVAVEQAETYWNILTKIKGSKLRLTKFDNDIYDTFIEHFPEYKDVERVKNFKEEELKSKEQKVKWRKFCGEFEENIEDYNFGTLLRTSSNDEYGQEGTIFVVRIQFYAFEIARNRAGLNDWICGK
ncbi:similar to Saccharomyces cerevisiae YPL225W Protein of unknown function that may interact with ribosomes, based on co-purification experiments [Maudiozyma barnettii]|uniref:Protein PBDC1 homolog n=1 Tax=Maudiozyma barnettii TaxID=61262 RepID=A0A8H2VEZ3_9SACH|nr:hypothetical protein [Kazachstania barnettii]CAB4254307.1 similar to Saccharomyces cerevisiae YPL225W Protein of unknown function that may interact with ribosomes, based on co-purification experiments [Kazachstania barnettii]CAD1782125.1 similar to Saccharomyces cerevisiae YPL225W Protein of unknown function that may interact with ribosomes, based on co-purification experiments [Kazachstania barnettii]